MTPEAAQNTLIDIVLDQYDRCIRFLVRLAALITVLIAFFITIAMILGVFFRFAFNSSIIWTEEISSLLLSVMMFLVIGIGLHERIHISVGVVLDRLPEKGRMLLDLGIQVFCSFFFAIVFWEGLKVAQIGMGMMLATVELPRGVFQYAAPIGCAFAMLVSINNIIKLLRGRQIPPIRGLD